MSLKKAALSLVVLASLASLPCRAQTSADASSTPIASRQGSALQGLANKQLKALILREVKFRNASFDAAMEYLRQKAALNSGGAVKLVYASELPADFKPRSELTLDLGNIPLLNALDFLGDLAGVDLEVRGSKVTARMKGKKSVVQQAPTPAPTPTELKQTATELNRPAERAYTGGNKYYSMGRFLQTEKSGHVPRRSMGGWILPTDDPLNMKETDVYELKR
jgi:hypothetical protein